MTSDLIDETMAWASAYDKRRRERAVSDAEEWFAENGREAIPDLEFETPDCPVCYLPTESDPDSFLCDVCGLTWDRNGTGGESINDHTVCTKGTTDDG